MKTHRLFLCLLGCTYLVLVVGHPVDQRRDISNILSRIGKTLDRVVGLGQDADEQREELSALINNDGEVSPPQGVEDDEVDSNSTSTNETTSTSTTASYVTVDIRPTATLATGGVSAIVNRTTSMPAILTTTQIVNQTSTRVPGQPTTSSVVSASTSVHLATSTPVTASLPVATSTPVTASLPVATSTPVTASLPVASSAPATATVPSTSRVSVRLTTTSTSSTSRTPSATNAPTAAPKKLDIPLIAGCAAGGAVAIVLLVCCVGIAFICVKKQNKGLRRSTTPERDFDCSSELSDVLDSEETNLPPFPNAEGDDYGKCFRSFLDQHEEYQEKRLKRMDLGSRMQKRWYQVQLKDDGHEKKILTIAPVSQHCPLKLHKHQKGLNKLLRVLKEHPYLHSIELVEYLSDHELLVMVQPLIKAGSLKDMIYKVTPLTNWSDKYARRSNGLPPDKIARYGRQILEAMKFLYDKGFPTLGHIQSGNIFVVNDVCRLGGYENTLLGYKTRLFRLCKDEMEHFDVILFGHLVFEMAAGYELTHLRPLEAEYKTVDKSVRPILEHIFEEGFPHDVDTISSHDFFSDSLSELSDFDSSQVQLTDSMNTVLEKVRKGKVRVQKSTKQKEGTETLAAKFKTTFRGIVPPKFGRGGEDSEKDLEAKLKKSQKKLKVKSAKDIEGVDRTPLLAETDSN